MEDKDMKTGGQLESSSSMGKKGQKVGSWCLYKYSSTDIANSFETREILRLGINGKEWTWGNRTEEKN